MAFTGYGGTEAVKKAKAFGGFQKDASEPYQDDEYDIPAHQYERKAS